MSECQVWAALSDKAAAGEALTGEQRSFLRRHPSECPGCAPEATLWADLERVLEEPERLTSRSNFERPRQAARGRLGQLVSHPVWQRRRLLAALALGTAAAAGAAIWSAPQEPRGEGQRRLAVTTSRWSSSKAAATNAAGAQLALSAGETFVNGRAALAGERLAAGAVVSVAVG